jgi:hypothetical protein
MATKDKFSFSIDGVKYTDIKGSVWGEGIYISVGGTSQMILQWMKQKYPNLPKTNYYWIKSSSFANGNSIDIYLNEAPQEFVSKLRSELEAHFEYGNRHYTSESSGTKLKTQTDEGKRIDYGTKYFSIQNRTPYGIKSEPVDWSSVLSDKSSKPAPTQQRSYPMGEVLQNCSGWIVSKKTLPDGRIVYNAKIKPDTPKNKGDWNQIKGEVYVHTGFKWGKFSSFDKWGQIERESEVLAELCNVLGKYYVQNEPQKEVPKEEPKPEVPQEQPKKEEAKEKKDLPFGEKVANELISAYMGWLESGTSANYMSEEWQKEFAQKMKEWKQDILDPYSLNDFGKDLLREQLLKKEKVILNNSLSLLGYFGDLSKKDFEKAFELFGKEAPFLNPKFYEEETQEMSKEKIEKAIAALKILAANGNEKAKSGIIALQYLLNK